MGLDFGEGKALPCSVMEDRTANGLCLSLGRPRGIWDDYSMDKFFLGETTKEVSLKILKKWSFFFFNV